ncbi:MAG: ABC transporter substrate-binding protein [Bacteroidota bacterium]
MKTLIYIVSFTSFLMGCKDNAAVPQKEKAEIVVAVKYAKGFTVTHDMGYKILEVHTPWPGAEAQFRYVLVEKGQEIPSGISFDAVVQVPVENIVVTSTTHIPALEALGVENKLIGFPSTKYISSEKTRKNIAEGRVKELGNNESLNTEVLIDLQPDILIGFAVNSENKVYETIQKSGISVVYNGDWMEETPLGKAEWIKFFAPFFNAETKADSIFNVLEQEYLNTKKIAERAVETPSILSGAMYKDVWYLPAGESWAAQFLNDAQSHYLWNDSPGTGSLSLSFESVLAKAQDADFWIAPAQFTTYEALENASNHYTQFKAFKRKRIYTFSLTKGATGGILYYELAPNRPDIVLKDLIHILHPELLPNHTLFFFKPLE